MFAGILYCLATLSDLATTTLALNLGLNEGNPVVAPMVNQYGLLPQVAISAVICGALWWYASRGGSKLVYVLAGIRWLVVANNALQIAQGNHVLALIR